jgi:nitroreductase
VADSADVVAGHAGGQFGGQFGDLVRRRRMTRAFSSQPLPVGLLEELVDLAARAPSAGKTQGWHAVVLEGAETARFWDVTLPAPRRDTFRWPRLLDAPVLLLPFADPGAYVARYAEPDKAGSGLGTGRDAWPTPYWTVDAAMAVMTLLLGAEDAGLGALFFGVFHGQAELRSMLGVPPGLELLGALALGYQVEAGDGAGRSAPRPRRQPHEIVHRGRW